MKMNNTDVKLLRNLIECVVREQREEMNEDLGSSFGVLKTRLAQKLKGKAGTNKKWGITWANGTQEQTGFDYEDEAKDWAADQTPPLNPKDYVTWEYTPGVDMVLRDTKKDGTGTGDDRKLRRARYVG